MGRCCVCSFVAVPAHPTFSPPLSHPPSRSPPTPGRASSDRANKMAITSGDKVFYYQTRDSLCFLTMTEAKYPKRLAFLYLDEVCDIVLQELVQEFGGNVSGIYTLYGEAGPPVCLRPLQNGSLAAFSSSFPMVSGKYIASVYVAPSGASRSIKPHARFGSFTTTPSFNGSKRSFKTNDNSGRN